MSDPNLPEGVTQDDIDRNFAGGTMEDDETNKLTQDQILGKGKKRTTINTKKELDARIDEILDELNSFINSSGKFYDPVALGDLQKIEIELRQELRKFASEIVKSVVPYSSGMVGYYELLINGLIARARSIGIEVKI